MTAEPHVCEPEHWNAPVGAGWMCPECGLEHVSRPVSELPAWVERMPGMADALERVAVTYWQGVADGR